MTCKDKNAPPTRADAQILKQLTGNQFLVRVAGLGSVVATARNASLRPAMQVTAVQVGGQWRLL